MSTLMQLWREVCGRSPALVNQEGKHLIVSESDCALLGSELERAAPTPAAQSAGQEAVAWRSSYVDPLTCARVYYVAQTETRARDLVAGRPYIEIEPLGVIAAPVNGGERELGQVIDERDQYHDAAEKLADAIAKHFGVEIGEHSNLNCPWQNALDHIAQATKRAADAQQVGGDELPEMIETVDGKNALCTSGRFKDWIMYKHAGGQWVSLREALPIEIEWAVALHRTRAALTSPAKEQK